MSEKEPSFIHFMGLKITPELSFGHIMQLALIIAAAIGLALGGQKWVTSVEYEIRALSRTVQQENRHIDKLDTRYQQIDERISRMEGKVDSIDKAVK